MTMILCPAYNYFKDRVTCIYQHGLSDEYSDRVYPGSSDGSPVIVVDSSDSA